MAKKGETALEKKQRKKKELWEDEDHLRQVDKSGGWKVVKKYEEEKEKERKQDQSEIKSDLETKKGRRFTYLRAVAEYGQGKLEKVDFPDGWDYHAVPTSGGRVKIYGQWFESKVGVLVVVKSPRGSVYIRGIESTFNPKYDVHAIDILVVQAENVVDSEKGILLSDRDEKGGLKRTKSGIILPN